MTLKERVKEQRGIADDIINNFPQITSVWFELRNIPVSEIKEMSEEMEREYSINEKDGKTYLRVQAHPRYDLTMTIFAYSVPVRITKPSFIEELEKP